MSVIDNVKILLGREGQEDKQLDAIVELTQSRLKTLLGSKTVPEELEYIVTEVSVSRFNRIGSEGLSGHAVEGETMNFKDNDFKAFEDDIEAWRSANKEQKIGKVRFILDMTLLSFFNILFVVTTMPRLVTMTMK